MDSTSAHVICAVRRRAKRPKGEEEEGEDEEGEVEDGSLSSLLMAGGSEGDGRTTWMGWSSSRRWKPLECSML